MAQKTPQGASSRDRSVPVFVAGQGGTISWKEWLRRVEDRYSDYRAAEWIAAGEKEPFLLRKRIADVSVGIRFESVAGIEWHETRKNDPVFRANVSDTGFRSLSFRGPAVKLEDVIVERMGEYREEQAKEARRNRRVRPLRKSVGKSRPSGHARFPDQQAQADRRPRSRDQ